jgi:hypothetical protein
LLFWPKTAWTRALLPAMIVYSFYICSKRNRVTCWCHRRWASPHKFESLLVSAANTRVYYICAGRIIRIVVYKPAKDHSRHDHGTLHDPDGPHWHVGSGTCKELPAKKGGRSVLSRHTMILKLQSFCMLVMVLRECMGVQ